MTENRNSGFIMPNSLAAIAAVRLPDSIVASDGIGCRLHVFAQNGEFQRHINTLRPYSRLRKSAESEGYTALGCCGAARIYTLDENFIETGYTELETACENACGCNCGGCCGNTCELTDAAETVIGNESFFIGAFRKSAYLFTPDGRRLTKLCSADRCETLTDFITFGTERYAMSTINGNTRTVTVSDGGITQSALLDRGYTLRMLIAEGGTVYGLFGRSYIYNRIIPIYCDGRLTLPKAL